MFLVKGSNSTKYALKRMYVNNEQDLAVCKREIQITVSVHCFLLLEQMQSQISLCLLISQSNLKHKNLIGYVDASITPVGNGVHEILMLMPYYKVHLLNLMNSK